ncbi:MAG: hypothetical protein ACQESB_07485 [Elusimicrobiota bacterium]
MSGTVSNINKEGFKFFNSLRALDSPLYLLFFVLAGAGLRIESFTRIGIVGGAYIVLRMTGKIVGGYFGGLAADIPSKMRKSIGAALMPQAGVSMGLAVIISSVYPEPAAGKLLLSIIVASTVVFEIFGPFLTRYALVKNSG